APCPIRPCVGITTATPGMPRGIGEPTGLPLRWQCDRSSGEAMATAEGFVRRITRRLTEDPQQRDAEELTGEADSTGAQRAVDCCRGQEVTMVGTLRSVETNAKGCAGGVRAEFFDGTDTVTLV